MQIYEFVFGILFASLVIALGPEAAEGGGRLSLIRGKAMSGVRAVEGSLMYFLASILMAITPKGYIYGPWLYLLLYAAADLPTSLLGYHSQSAALRGGQARNGLESCASVE